MKKLATLVMPYYLNPTMLAEHYKAWAQYSDFVKERLEVIIVDDGSPADPAADIAVPPDVQLRISFYRVLKDIPWNQHGARNLGAHHATTKWLIMTDMDHLIRADDMEKLLMKLGSCKENRTFTFNRVDAPDMTPTVRPDGTRKPHVNSFAVWRKTYWAIGGYDEDYCGMYGTDSLFRSKLFGRYATEHLRHVSLVRYSRDVIADASTHTLERRAPGLTTKTATKERTAWKAQQGRLHQIVTLNFPWEHVLTLDPSLSYVGNGASPVTASDTPPITSTQSKQWSDETTEDPSASSASPTTPEE